MQFKVESEIDLYMMYSEVGSITKYILSRTHFCYLLSKHVHVLNSIRDLILQ